MNQATAAADGEILLAVTGGLGEITLNRPKALNAVTQPMVTAMDAQLKTWAEDPAIGAVVVRGAPRDETRVPFCAGGDIRLIYDERNDPDRKFAVEFYAEEYRLNSFIYRYPKPYIALIDGVVMGGGVGVSIHGSHRVMSERTMFAMPETGIGLIPDIGATYFLSRLPGRTGLYLGLTAARIGGADALHLGLATHYVPSDRMAALDTALREGDYSTRAHAAVGRILDGFAEDPGVAPIVENLEAIDRCFGGETVEQVIAKLQAEGTPWAEETLAALDEKSPTSLKVTFRQLTTLGDLDLEDALKMEYRMAIRCNFGPELFEGIRAVVIDKDRSPKWHPASVAEVSDDLVAEHFAVPATGDMTF